MRTLNSLFGWLVRFVAGSWRSTADWFVWEENTVSAGNLRSFTTSHIQTNRLEVDRGEVLELVADKWSSNRRGSQRSSEEAIMDDTELVAAGIWWSPLVEREERRSKKRPIARRGGSPTSFGSLLRTLNRYKRWKLCRIGSAKFGSFWSRSRLFWSKSWKKIGV